MYRPRASSVAFVLAFAIALAAGSRPAAARDVGGIEIPDELAAAGGQPSLRLNGAGVRRKLFVAVYAIGLYLPAPMREADRVLAVDGRRLVVMQFLHREVPREKLVGAWNEGFAANHDPAALAVLQPRIDRFNGFFDTLREGDRVELEFVPDRQVTQVRVKGQVRGEVPGTDFATALLRIWLGASPVSDDLRAALLGP